MSNGTSYWDAERLRSASENLRGIHTRAGSIHDELHATFLRLDEGLKDRLWLKCRRHLSDLTELTEALRRQGRRVEEIADIYAYTARGIMAMTEDVPSRLTVTGQVLPGWFRDVL